MKGSRDSGREKGMESFRKHWNLSIGDQVTIKNDPQADI